MTTLNTTTSASDEVCLIERTRLNVSKTTAASKKAELGQFLTPAATAKFMASLFPVASGECRLLDAGAGIGSLADAFLQRWQSGDFHFSKVALDAFEIDTTLHRHLQQTLDKYACHAAFSASIQSDDFIHVVTNALTDAGGFFATPHPAYTHAILNPPTKKSTAILVIAWPCVLWA